MSDGIHFLLSVTVPQPTKVMHLSITPSNHMHLMVCVNVQVLGLFIVQITAAGCLYFLDPTNIANDRGLVAAGILLMLLNIAYVAAMLILIGINGASKTKQYTRTVFVWVRTSSARLQQSLSGRVSAGSGTEQNPRVAEDGVGGQVGVAKGSHTCVQDARGLKWVRSSSGFDSLTWPFKVQTQCGHDSGQTVP